MNHLLNRNSLKLIQLSIAVFIAFTSIYSQALAQEKRIKRKTHKPIVAEFPNSPKVTVTAPNAAVYVNNGGEKGEIILEFRNDGQLSSYPPEKVKPGQTISARLELDQEYWIRRINNVISSWITTSENIKNYDEKNKFINYGLNYNNDLLPVQQEIKYQLLTFINNSKYIPVEQKNYYKSKINLIMPHVVLSSTNTYVPSIETLITPKYTIEFQFYNNKGLRIDKSGNLYSHKEDEPEPFIAYNPSGRSEASIIYYCKPIVIPENCYEVKYNLVIENSISKLTVDWAKNDIFPVTFISKLDMVKKAIDDVLMAEYKSVYEAASKVKNDLAKKPKIPAALSKQATDLDTEVNDVLSDFNNTNSEEKRWIMKWLWLSNGVPMINPFDFQQEKLFVSAENKLSNEERSLYQIFENMLNKGSFQIDNITHIDSDLKNLHIIKAKLDAEAKAKVKETQLYNHYLYQGVLKSSVGSNHVFMRHLNAKDDYLIMNRKPKKEITEDERLYVLTENKNLSEKLTIGFTTIPITSDNSLITTQVNDQFGDKSIRTSEKDGQFGNNALVDTKNKAFVQSKTPVKKFLILVDALTAKVNNLRSLTKPPVLPIFFEYDKTPDLMTDVIEHDFLYEAPATASYSVKRINTDTTVVHQGNYRINKLYRWRIKAGVIYSGFQKSDFTETSTNQYTLDSPSYGIDGTFGVQTYFKKQDIRSTQVDWNRLYGYVGLSMRNITENFYLGVGIEPVSGIALGINSHIGKREVLTGAEGVPTAIRQTWGVGVGGSILIDAALFVKLFSFGSNRTVLGF